MSNRINERDLKSIIAELNELQPDKKYVLYCAHAKIIPSR